jgi:hypothetical protein
MIHEDTRELEKIISDKRIGDVSEKDIMLWYKENTHQQIENARKSRRFSIYELIKKWL